MLRRMLLPFILLIPLLVSAPPQALAGQLPYGPPVPTPPPPPLVPPGVSYLHASPYEGHFRDVLWLSGANLKPNTQYSLLFTCPAWTDPTVYHWGNLLFIENGPVTDLNGTFTRYPIKTITLHHLPLGSKCFVLAEEGGQNGYDLDHPAQYYLFPHSWHLASCAIVICGKVSVSPTPPHSGRFETLEVDSHGFGGAYVDITIRFGNGVIQPIHTSVGPSGTKYLRVKIPAQLPRVTKEQISARFHLGSYKGYAKPTEFTIVR